MKILYSSCKNPHFVTITEYIENALKRGHEVEFFENRAFIIPGRARDTFPFLNKMDILRLNKNLLSLAREYKPDIFLETGGYRILPRTVEEIKKAGITTVLWTIDPPRDFAPVIKSAPHYDFVFTGGSEAYEILNNYPIKSLHHLPFACDPDIHRSVQVTDAEKSIYASDVVFVGSYYPNRLKLLENLSDLNIGIWGPGWEKVPAHSPLQKRIRRADGVTYEEWIKIYSCCKIAIAIHFHDDNIPCFQASPRVYEALACRCFLLADKQRDASSLFRDNEHLVLFNDGIDLREKITYYLNSSQARENIAERGYEHVIGKHTYVHRTGELMNIAGGGN